MSSIPVIRWGQAMERNDIGGFVTYHDYAMLYEQMESLRSDMQRRIKIGKELTDEIDRLRAQRDELAVALRTAKQIMDDAGITCFTADAALANLEDR